MSVSPDLVGTLARLVDTMVDQYDVVEFLQDLAESCVETTGISEAGIMLADPAGLLRYVASSHERMRLVELFELQIDEGPCIDTFRSGEPTYSSSPDDADRRWPKFGPHARTHGFPGVSAVPMRLRAQTIGVLNLFSSSVAPLSETDRNTAQVLADFATIGILHERALRDAQALSAQLSLALDSRVVIEQAKGIVAERLGIGVDPAFDLLRDFARSHNRLLSRTAQDVVERAMVVAPLLERP